MRKLFTTLLISFLINITGFAQTTVGIHGQLQVDGTKLRDACGRVTQLKGMSYFWHQWERTTEYVNSDVIQWLADDWQIELIRIPVGVRSGDACTVVGTSTLSAGQCGSNPGGITGKTWGYNTARAAIRAAIDAGVYILVDWHAHPNELAAAKEFFATMSAEFGQYPNVIYETWNEPIGEFGGGASKWAEIKSYSEEIIATIRANDPDNIIVVGTPFYAQFVDVAANNPIMTDSRGNAVNDIMYSFHIYSGLHGQGLRDRANAAISRGIPLFMTEMGRTADNGGIDESEWQRWLTWIDDNDISFAKWSLSIKNEVYSSLQSSASTSGNWNDNDLTSEDRWNRNYFRSVNTKATACNDTPPSTGNVTVRARGTTGSEQIEVRYSNQRVGDPIPLTTSFQEYRVQVNNPNGTFRVAFVNDNGPRDAEVDWLRVGTTTRQAESRSTNTAVWQNGSCGGSNSSRMNCNGYIDFGTMGSGGSNDARSLVIRARGTCGSETMTLRIGGQDVQTWTNLSTTLTDYSYPNYSEGNVRVVFSNDGTTGSGCDKNLVVDRITVCGTTLQAESATRNGCGSQEWLYCNGNFDFGAVGCGSALTAPVGSASLNNRSAAFSTYPNPATGQLTVSGGSDYRVEIYDLSGRPVMRHDHLRNKTSLDISHLRPGVYVVKMSDGQHEDLQERLIVE